MAGKSDVKVKKLHFLFLSSDKFPPFRVDVKSLFCEEMAQRGHQIDWILQAGEPCERSYQTSWGGGTAWVGKNSASRSYWGAFLSQLYDFRNDCRLFRLARNNKYDFIQVKDKFLAALLAMAACRLGEAKFIYWLSFPFPESHLYRAKQGKGYSNFPLLDLFRGHLFRFLLYHIILPRADHVFVQSKQMKEDVAAKGISAARLTAVPMGVALSGIPSIAQDNASAEEGLKRVVYIGSLSKPRKIDFLISVFRLVIDEYQQARLYLIGGESDADVTRMKQYAREAGLQDVVEVTGFLPLAEAWRYVSMADVCVSPLAPNPTFAPASPTKLVEYMAFGKPVVANDHPEQREVLKASGGGLCVPYEKEVFADAVLELLRDSNKAADMGMRGRHYIEKHRCYRVIADMVESTYYDVLAEERLQK